MYDALGYISTYYTVTTRFCCIRNTAGTNSSYYGISHSETHSNDVGDYIALNYTFMTHRVGIY